MEYAFINKPSKVVQRAENRPGDELTDIPMQSGLLDLTEATSKACGWVLGAGGADGAV